MNRREFMHGTLAATIAASLPARRSNARVWRALTRAGSTIEAVSGDGAPVALEAAAVNELADSLRGGLLLTGTDDYDLARRVMNASIDKYPALIVQPNGVADIQHAVRFAADRDLLLAVKCGGHSWSGKSTCNGGLQLDLSSFRHVRVDTHRRRAFVAGGSLLAELDRESMAQGLVTTTGTVSHTGVSGLTLGGGFGRLGRRFGLALDNVRSVDIVGADGALRHANSEQNPDLYWGVRGGGGNFGVVSAFEFALQPMTRTVIAGDLVFPMSRLRDVLSAYAEISSAAPDSLYIDFVATAPAGGAAGVCLLHVCHSGTPTEARHDLAAFERLGTPLRNTLGSMDYVALQRAWDISDPRVNGEYLKSGFVNGIDGPLIDALAAGFEAHPGRGTTVAFQHAGGAIGRVPVAATAFAHRYASHGMFSVISWPVDAQAAEHIAWQRRYWRTLEPFTEGYYTNDTADESQRAINSNYRGNFERLLEIKKRYDPDNLFRLNANIQVA